MNVLFITSSRLGDAVLSTGLLDHIIRTYPESSITVVCGGLPASLFEGMPHLKEIITLKKQSWNRHWIGLLDRVRKTRWDMIVDLRDSAVSRLLPAKKKFIFTKRIDRKLHKAEQAAAIMKLDYIPAPRLWPTSAQIEKARCLIPPGAPVIGVGPTANWIGKTWPADCFIEVIKNLTAPNGPFPDSRVAVFAAPGEEKIAQEVLHSVPIERRLDLIAKTDPGTAAAALSLCDFYIGNDSGLMHCAAAAGTPTFGVFGPSWPHLYRPWGNHCAYAATKESYDELISFPGYDSKTCGSLMTSLAVEDVIRLILSFLENYKKTGSTNGREEKQETKKVGT